MDLGLAGRTVIVTGAAGELGRHIAAGFAAEGADVVLTYHRSQAETERLAKELGERTLVARFALDQPETAPALVEAVLAWSGRIDVLVNNAVDWGGEAPSPDRAFEDVSEEAWLAILRHNLEGSLRLTRAVVPVMRQRRWGRLVHISSTIAVDGLAGAEYYAAAKAALHGFSRSAAYRLGRDGDLLSNVVMPGLMRTEINAHIVAEAGEQYAALAAIGRLLDAAEVARPVVYLGSAANTGITGAVIPVSGGT